MSIIEKSSVNLINLKETFDLIWIDGAHFDPIVTMDLINSLNLLSDNGFILCDDIRKSEKNATWRSINTLKKENIIEFDLMLKWWMQNTMLSQILDHSFQLSQKLKINSENIIWIKHQK